MKAMVLALALGLVGCSCAVPEGLAGVGIGGAVVTGDPSHAIMPVVDAAGCIACQVELSRR